MVFANVSSCNTWLRLMNKEDYIIYFVNSPVQSVNYCDGLVVVFALFVFMLALLPCLCVATVFQWIKIYTTAFHSGRLYCVTRWIQEDKSNNNAATLSRGLVSGIASQDTYATRISPTAASGVNSRHIGFLATGAQCDILLNCAL